MNIKVETLDPKIIPFQGERRSFIWEVFNSGSVKDGFIGIPELGYVVDIVNGLYSAVYPYRNPDLAEKQVRKVLNNPREILMLAKHNGEYVGYGAFPRLRVDEDSFMYSSRAFLAEFDGDGLGTNALDQAIDMHNEELARAHRHYLVYGALYTQNPASIASVIRSERTNNIHPFRNFGGFYEMNSTPQRVMQETHARFLANSRVLYNLTGVCKGELWGLGANQSYIPGRSALADEIHREMVGPDDLDMNIPQGDVVIVVYDIKKPEIAERALVNLAA